MKPRVYQDPNRLIAHWVDAPYAPFVDSNILPPMPVELAGERFETQPYKFNTAVDIIGMSHQLVSHREHYVQVTLREDILFDQVWVEVITPSARTILAIDVVRYNDPIRTHANRGTFNNNLCVPPVTFDWVDGKLVRVPHDKAFGFRMMISGAYDYHTGHIQRAMCQIEPINGISPDVMSVTALGYTIRAHQTEPTGTYMSDAVFDCSTGQYLQFKYSTV